MCVCVYVCVGAGEYIESIYPTKGQMVPSRGDNPGNIPGLANVITVYQATGDYLSTGHKKARIRCTVRTQGMAGCTAQISII